MRDVVKIALITCTLIVAGCAGLAPSFVVDQPDTYSYTNPEDSGLKAAQPFPGPSDVCVSLKQNAITKPFESENHFLIACPRHETDAIGDRITQQQAAIVGDTKHWVVLSVPSYSMDPMKKIEINFI